MCVSIPTRGQDGGGIGQESEDVQNRARVGGGAESVRVADEVRNRAGSEDVRNRAKLLRMCKSGRSRRMCRGLARLWQLKGRGARGWRHRALWYLAFACDDG